MPANLTPEYREAEQRFREAQTPEDKLTALEDMLRVIPKHKGTEKMQADIKRRIARLRAEAARRPSAARQRTGRHVRREGAGQAVLAGPPNSGKSALLAALTNAQPEVAGYPFTTREPQPGMMPFENVQVQLVDLPPLARGLTPPWVLGLIRAADLTLLVLDLGDDDILAQAEETLELLRDGRADLSRGLVVATKADRPGAAERLILLEDLLGDQLPIISVSAERGDRLEDLRRRVFESLGVIRVYTKAPGKKPDLTAPFVLPRGTTLVGAAAVVHKDFARDLKFARVWGATTFEGQMVQRDHVLQDGDVVEFRV
ncbi:MAG: TGS domain-containing protein [bacterium]|nr:TGS domain-containing protein [bacterium]